jgi:integrase
MGRSAKLVTRRKESNNYWTNFTVNGERVRRSLQTADKSVAEMLAAQMQREMLLAPITKKKPECSLGVALTQYHIEVGQFCKGAPQLKSLARMVACGRPELGILGLGKDILLSQISDRELAAFVAQRRTTLSNASLNQQLRFLRAVINRARDLWGYMTPEIKWKKHFLKERTRQRFLSNGEEKEFFDALPLDAHAILKFAILTGLRASNLAGLKWTEVKDDHIEIVVKGDKDFHLPITTAMAAILENERGRHPEWVFTYIARTSPRGKHVIGKRYPFTRPWLWTVSNKALRAAGLWNGKSDKSFRFHDFRHTAASRLLAATSNLKLVQEYLGHSNIATTMKYAHIVKDDLRQGLEKLHRSRPSR